MEDSTRIKHHRVRPRAADEHPCLEVVKGVDEGRRIFVREGSIVLGRGDGSATSFTDDGVSRRHARVVVTGHGIINLEDLGSTNGTYVNGARVDVVVLREGDRIQLGPDVTLRFDYRAPSEASSSRQRPMAAAPVVLSPREMEVAHLVAEGLTNPQIAERLHISRHTVVSHVSNILGRTGAPTRAALAKLVAEGGVSPSR
jgi:DNA-binding CsgD family transcriptional regulator